MRIDASNLDDQALEARVQEDVEKPFDLRRGPLLRATLFERGPQNYVLCVTMHHIVSDGWSIGVLVRELVALYAAFANGHPAAVSIGVRPTFETGRGVLIETHVIDRELDLYAKSLRIAFIARLRGERRFADTESLVAQMHEDVERARELCAAFRPPR